MFTDDWVRNDRKRWDRIGDYVGALYRNRTDSTLWKWKEIVVRADSADNARVELGKRLNELSPEILRGDWEQWGKGKAIVGDRRGAIYRSKTNPSLWRWRDLTFEADSPSSAINYLMGYAQAK